MSSRTQIELPCKLSWGTDPKIELSGIAVEIGIDSIMIALPEPDKRLWPAVGRRVGVEITWMPQPAGPTETAQKRLSCRGSVSKVDEAADGSLILSCTVRKGRFVDVHSSRNAAASMSLKPVNNGWKM